MISSANDYRLDEVFKKDANYYYKIPRYQREYVWGRKQWEELYDDIGENDPGYFIGSIICINNEKDSFKTSCLEIIDGQQRLTTVCLLLLAIYSALKQYRDKINDDDIDELLSLKKSLLHPKSPNGLIIYPQIQSNNLPDFNYVMSQSGLVDEVDKPVGFGKRRIAKCYEYFKHRIELDIANESDPNKIPEVIIGIKKKVMQTVLVKIEVNNHAAAYTLFESLNDRGTPLTAIDLIKNCVLSNVDQAKTDDANNQHLDLYFDKWQRLLSYITDDYATQERFFRQYYNAFKNRLNEPFRHDDQRAKDPLGSIATRSNLLFIFEKLINNNLSEFMDDILKCGRIYATLILNSNDSGNVAIRNSLANLSHIQGAPSYLLLMYLLRQKDELQIDDDNFRNIVDLLTRFFVRRNITDTPGTRDLTRNFMQIISYIEQNSLKGNDIYKYIYQTLSDQSASDEQFRKSLSGNIYEDNSNVARFILCDICQRNMTNETWTNLWEQISYGNHKVYKWTIEHVFPEGKNIPDAWVDMIADGNHSLANEYLEKYAHTLGNLTITGYNSALSNKSFVDKRDRCNKDGLPIGYKNGLVINADISTKEKWTINDIKERTAKLVGQALEMYKL